MKQMLEAAEIAAAGLVLIGAVMLPGSLLVWLINKLPSGSKHTPAESEPKASMSWIEKAGDFLLVEGEEILGRVQSVGFPSPTHYLAISEREIVGEFLAVEEAMRRVEENL